MMQPELTERDLREAEQDLADSSADPRIQLQAAIGRLFAGEDGQFVLAWLRRYVQHGRAVLVPGEPDTTAFLLGRQDPVNAIVNFLTMPYAELVAMMQAPSGLPMKHGVDPMWTGPVKDDFLYPKGPEHGNAERP
ncbi:MAG TPA: hypothetical protein VM238_23005 [Phycisphaerae bacterium]|nr:hypothetical protein [Phycisphaerae bacterium]